MLCFQTGLDFNKTNMAQELAEKLMANLSVKAEEGEEEVKPTDTPTFIKQTE